MTMNAISPGVYRKITDLSLYVEAVPSTIGFIALLAEKGRDNTLMFASSEKAIRQECGNPNIDQWGQGMYNAVNFLRNSAGMYYIRVLPFDVPVGKNDANFANIFLKFEDASGFTGNVLIEKIDQINSTAEVNTKLIEASQYRFCAFYGRGRGQYYNNISINLTASATVSKGYVLDVYAKDSDGDDVLQESFLVSFYTGQQLNGRSIFVEDIVNEFSQIISAKVNSQWIREIDAVPVAWNAAQPFDTIKPLEYGTEGDFLNADGTVNWTDPDVGAYRLLADAYSGLIDASVINTDLIYFTVVFDGDYNVDVRTAIVNLCQTLRGDCVGILDNGIHGTVASAVADRQSVNNFNSYFVALYENHTRVYDPFTGRDIWVSPSYWMSSVIPYNDTVADPWWAPAGFNRAALNGVKEAALYPNKVDRDDMYIVQLNPIARLKPGYVIWGQQTTWSKPSALRDLNIVRLVLYIDAALKNFALYYVFDQNDAFTWNDFQVKVHSFLTNIKNRRGLRSFSVSVFATEYERQTNTFHADIYLHATSTVEKIFLNYFVTK